MKKKLIIVSGAPASGKTTLSRRIASECGIGVVNKDSVKELLFDCFGIREETKEFLGVAGFKLTYFVCEKMLDSGKVAVVEGNFENKFALKEFENIIEKHDAEVFQIMCCGEYETFYRRYKEREDSADRHWGHVKLEISEDRFVEVMRSKEFLMDIRNSRVIKLDTTSFDEEYEKAEASLLKSLKMFIEE